MRRMKHSDSGSAGAHLDQAVSPVIATILMVAVTVVLAATAYYFSTGFGSAERDSVSASFVVEGDNDRIEIFYASGPRLAAGDVRIRVNDALVDDGSSPDWQYDAGNGEPDTWAVGEQALLVPTAGNAAPEDDWEVIILVRGQVLHHGTVKVL